MDEVTGYIDSGNNVDVVLFDFTKAFDKVPHKRLVVKVGSHSIWKLLSWISDRVGETEIKGCVFVLVVLNRFGG